MGPGVGVNRTCSGNQELVLGHPGEGSDFWIFWPTRWGYRHIYIYVGGTFRVYVAILASGKITENVVRNGVHKYKMLYFLGTLQEPTVNTVKTRSLWVCDVPSQTLLAASKHCKTSCFRCLTLKNAKIATLHLKDIYICIYIYML